MRGGLTWLTALAVFFLVGCTSRIHVPYMPQEGRDALWGAFGRPERISVGYTHKRAFLAMTPLGFNGPRYRIYNLLDEALDAPRRRRRTFSPPAISLGADGGRES